MATGPTPASSRRSERVANVLRRVVDTAARVIRSLTILAVAAAAAVTAAWITWVAGGPPARIDGWISRLVVLAIALVPPGVLVLFVAGLRDLRELPGRARSLPADVRGHAAELRDRARRTSEPRGLLGMLAALFRLGRLVVGARDVLSPYAVVAAVLRPAILLAALVATVAAVVEIPAAALALLFLLA